MRWLLAAARAIPIGSVDEALAIVPEFRQAFENSGPTFDQLFGAHYGFRPVSSKHLERTPQELAALAYLYPEIRRLFELRHGRIIEEYWCTTLPAAAVRTELPDFFAIVDWQQEDAAFVDLAFTLDEVVVGTNSYLLRKKDVPTRTTCFHVVFDAYSSVLDALENRRLRNLTSQTEELRLVKEQVATARAFYKNAGQRLALTESLIGMSASFLILAAVVGVVGTFLWIVKTDLVAGIPLGPTITWASAGALGAFVSVLARIARDDFTPTWEASQAELRAIGAIRPVLGAVLGAAIPIFVISGLTAATGVDTVGDTLKVRYLYLALAFGAGFSERWAQDLISKQPSALASSAEKTGGTKAP